MGDPKLVTILTLVHDSWGKLTMRCFQVRKRAVFVYTMEDALGRQQTMNIIPALRSSIRNPAQVKAHYQTIYDVQAERMVSAGALMSILGFRALCSS